MASGFSHAVAALSIGTWFYRPGLPKRVWLAGALCSVLPDIDVVGFHFGIRYGDFWGHRGFTHSLFFAAILATLVTFLALRAPNLSFRTESSERGILAGSNHKHGRSEQARLILPRSVLQVPQARLLSLGSLSSSKLFPILWVWTYLFLATASHGFLDAMTNGGLGVAFFSPFNNHRYFLPWRPILVSPIGVGRFFSDRGFAVLKSELLWIWLPSVLLAVLAWQLRGRRAPTAS